MGFFLYFYIKVFVRMSNFRYSIITCNFGNYELIREISNPLSDVEYIYVTDDETITSNTWTVIYDKRYDKIKEPFDKVVEFRSRVLDYCNSDICLRLDGSIKFRGDYYEELVKTFNDDNYDISFIMSPRCSNIIHELEDWEYIRGLPKNIINNFLEFADNNSLVKNVLTNSICCLGLLLQRKNDLNRLINARQFAELNYFKNEYGYDSYFRCDQIFFTYVINNYFRGIKVLPLSYDVIFNKSSCLMRHNTNTPIYEFKLNLRNTVFLFDEPLKKLFNGYTWYYQIDKEYVMSNAKTFVIDTPKSYYSNSVNYEDIKESLKVLENTKEYHLISNISENEIYYSVNNEIYFTNDWYYSNVLRQLCETLKIDYDEEYYIRIKYSEDILVPKYDMKYHFIVPKIIFNNEGRYFLVNAPYLFDSKMEELINSKDLSINTDYNNFSINFYKQFKFSSMPCRIMKSIVPDLKTSKILLVISDGSITPFLPFLMRHYDEVINIDNYLYNFNFSFLYNYLNITDVLIFTSNNKHINLILNNL